MAEIPHDGREYITWPITNVPDTVPVEVQFLHASITAPAWYPTTRTSPTEVRALVAGPDITQGAAVIQLPAGRTFARVRFTSGDEVVIRNAGTIDVRQ